TAFFLNKSFPTASDPLSLHDALPISHARLTAYVTYRALEEVEIRGNQELSCLDPIRSRRFALRAYGENDITFASLNTEYFVTRRSEEHTSELQSRENLVCRLLLEKKK